MSTLLTTFLPEVVPYVPHAPEPIVINAIRNALIEFCEKTAWDTYECVPQDSQVGVSDYEADTPAGAEVSRVMSAFYDGVPLTPVSDETIRRMFPAQDWRDLTGTPRWWVQLDRHILRLVPQPDVAIVDAVKIVVALRPTRTATVCTDDLWNLWGEGIAKGAVARLQVIPQQAFTNQRSADQFMKQFLDTIGRAKIDRNRGLARGVLRAVPQVF